MRFHLLFSFLLCLSAGLAQNPKAYTIYTGGGKKVSYPKMIKKLLDKEVIFFGELHNSSVAHWLEYEIALSLFEKKGLILGMEMFERDNQDEIDAYLTDSLSYHEFTDTTRLWPNFATDYYQLLLFAKDKSLPLIATNVPRRYATKVYHEGIGVLEKLHEKEKPWLAPLPFPFDSTLKTYKKMMNMDGSHGGTNLVRAQALKDATMAYSINEFQEKNKVFLHLNGSFHSDYYEGILWYLNHYNPALTTGTISCVVQKDINTLNKEHLGKADFIICINENVTNSY